MNLMKKFVICDDCDTLRPRIEFSIEMRQAWGSVGSGTKSWDTYMASRTKFYCNRCSPEAETIEASYYCGSCKAKRPGNEFIDEHVTPFLLGERRHPPCIRCHMQTMTDLPEGRHV